MESFFHSHVLGVSAAKVISGLDHFMHLNKYRRVKKFGLGDMQKFRYPPKSNEELFLVFPQGNDYVSVMGTVPEEDLMQFSHYISETEKARVWWLMVYEGDVFLYTLFKKGEIVAEYNSCPNYFEDQVSNREIIESKEDTATLVKEFAFLKPESAKIKAMLTEGWVINQKDFERDSKYLDPVTLLKDFGKAIKLDPHYLTFSLRDLWQNPDFFTGFGKKEEVVFLWYRKKSLAWLWLMILLFIFSGKLIQLISAYTLQ